MNLITILLLAISLAADAFAVSVATGISEKKVSFKNAIKMSFGFWFFQALMPIIWFFLAGFFSEIIRDYDHWIAFILLTYIGGNMASSGWKGSDMNIQSSKNTFGWKSVFILSVATSIDALAVGVSLTASISNIWIPALFIGVITFFLSFLGIEFGKKWGTKIGNRAEIIGGCILILIGCNILREHLIG